MLSTKIHREDIPWLVNGSLTEPERTEVQAGVEASDELRNERDFLSAIRNTVKQQAPADIPLEMAWHRLLRDIRREQKSGVSSSWRYIAIAASLLLLVQGMLVWLPPDSQVRYRPLSSQTTEATLLVRFVDEVPQKRINQLLHRQHLRIIDGPGATGLYRLSTDGDLSSALAVLKQQTEIIAYVQVR